ncbi:MAG: hypothetical protein WD042_08095 [Phycisphaeraceae bacterium]
MTLAVARGLAAALSGFTLLNIAGNALTPAPGFDANLWWIDLRPLPRTLASCLLLLAAAAMLAFALKPAMSSPRRRASATLIIVLVHCHATNLG